MQMAIVHKGSERGPLSYDEGTGGVQPKIYEALCASLHCFYDTHVYYKSWAALKRFLVPLYCFLSEVYDGKYRHISLTKLCLINLFCNNLYS